MNPPYTQQRLAGIPLEPLLHQAKLGKTFASSSFQNYRSQGKAQTVFLMVSFSYLSTLVTRKHLLGRFNDIYAQE